ncbi:MAG: DUF5615 family PIN-like protein [Acidimicrobiia bacterium]
MKLLIDEMWPPAVAAGLRRAGHDAMPVSGDPSLMGASDAEILAVAARMRRGVVTENAADFLALAAQRSASGQPVPALVVTSNRSFPRHARSFVGRAVRSLASFCDIHPEDDPQTGAVFWLGPPA